MVRLVWFARTEIYQNKRNVLKGSRKFPNIAIRNQFQAIRQFLSASRGMRQHGCCWEFCFPVHASCQLLSKNFEGGFGHSKVRSELIDSVHKRAQQPLENQQFSSVLSSWKLQWLILSGILRLPPDQEVIPRQLRHLWCRSIQRSQPPFWRCHTRPRFFR